MRLRNIAVYAWTALALCLPAGLAHAVKPDEVLSDPKLEQRARHLSAGLRCLVCQNQSIDDSDAPLAADLRRVVRERLQANDTDQQVIDFVVSRYGDFVLLKPPLKPSTLILWLSPLLVLAGGVVLARRAARTGGDRAATANDGNLSAEERAALARILKDQDA